MENRTKPKKQIITLRNKHIARDISRSCNMPYEEAYKLLEVIINIFQVELKSAGQLRMGSLGKLKISKLKRPSNRAAYRITTFQMSQMFSKYLGNIAKFKYYEMHIELARKILRLFLAGDRSYKHFKKLLLGRFARKPDIEEFMRRKGYWPLDKLKLLDSNKSAK